MKKFIAAFLIILVLTLSGCGEASDVGVHLTDSQRYSETELNNVVEAAKSFFAKNFDPELFTPVPGNRLNTGKPLIKMKNRLSPKR